ncbi:MAG: hypothetical protein ACHQU0_02575 [Candidatus Paceibacteria bacterium]
MLKETDIQKNVLEKIHAGGVAMHSRTYFVLRTALLGLFALAVLAISFFVLSFVFFSVHESGMRYLLEFNEHGLVIFVSLFPWIPLILFVALLVALEVILRRFEFTSKLPLLRIFLWILIIGIAGSTILGFTPLHASLLGRADNDQLPILGPWYEGIRDSHQTEGVYRGDVTAIEDADFVISHNDTDRDSDEGSWTIAPPPGFDLHQLSVGEKVYVAGRLRNGTVYAYGVHVVQEVE